MLMQNNAAKSLGTHIKTIKNPLYEMNLRKYDALKKDCIT